MKMIAGVSSALDFRKRHPNADSEKILRHVSEIVRTEKDVDIKLGMIAAASKAVSLIEKNPSLKDREVIKIIMDSLPEIVQNISIGSEI